MKKLYYLLLPLVLFCLSSCELVEGIFKAGFYSALIIVVIVVIIILWIFSKFRKK